MNLEVTHPFAGRHHAALVRTESGAWENHLCKIRGIDYRGDARSVERRGRCFERKESASVAQLCTEVQYADTGIMLSILRFMYIRNICIFIYSDLVSLQQILVLQLT